VELINVAARDEALKFTVEPFTKFVPVIVSVNPGDPRIALDGLMAEIVGARSKIPKTEDDSPPPGAGLTAWTTTLPEVWMAEAGIAAVTCDALTKVVGSV
jgi:hypothetical protein